MITINKISNRLNKLSIMLIDDDDLIRDSLGRALRIKFGTFLTFESAEEGLDVLDRQKFDVIICDYKLLGMDGLEFFKRVSVLSSQTLKILITAFGDDEEVVDGAKSIGMDAVIEKPFSVETLIDTIIRFLE